MDWSVVLSLDLIARVSQFSSKILVSTLMFLSPSSWLRLSVSILVVFQDTPRENLCFNCQDYRRIQGSSLRFVTPFSRLLGPKSLVSQSPSAETLNVGFTERQREYFWRITFSYTVSITVIGCLIPPSTPQWDVLRRSQGFAFRHFRARCPDRHRR